MQFSSKIDQIDLLKNQWPHVGLPHAQPQEAMPRKSLKKKKPDSLENSKGSNGLRPINSWPLKNLRVLRLRPNDILKNQEVGVLKIFHRGSAINR